MNVAIVGCGVIAAPYARTIAASPDLTLVGATDQLPGRAATLVEEFGGTEFASLEALLAADAVQTVVNLTPPQAHASVTATCLEAGKHVHTEKPVAFLHAEAKDLAQLAESNGVRLSCAPATLLGEAQQTAWKLIREGTLGRIRIAYAEANWGRIESWHPSPETLYAAGPLVDVGVYPLTIVTAILGPVRRVLAHASMVQADRVTQDGRSFRPGSPDFIVAVLELDGGALVRLTANFWVRGGRQRGLEFHGDDAALHLASWLEFDSRLEQTTDGDGYTPVPLLREPYQGIEWSRPLSELASAIAEGRPHRASAEHAAHVVETLNAITESFRDGGYVEVHSTFTPPEPLPWAT